MKKIQRPTLFDQNIANEICDRIVQGESIKKIVTDESMPDMRTIEIWRSQDPVFYRQYLVAFQNKAELLVDEIRDIEEMMKYGEITPQQAKIMVDNRKWWAEKFFPEMFGPKATLDVKTTLEEKKPYTEADLEALRRLGIAV